MLKFKIGMMTKSEQFVKTVSYYKIEGVAFYRNIKTLVDGYWLLQRYSSWSGLPLRGQELRITQEREKAKKNCCN